jgi:hydrogenase/urease accessory protein HupE
MKKILTVALLSIFGMLFGSTTAVAHEDHNSFLDITVEENSIILESYVFNKTFEEFFNIKVTPDISEQDLNIIYEDLLNSVKVYSGDTLLTLGQPFIDLEYEFLEIQPILTVTAFKDSPIEDEITITYDFINNRDRGNITYVFFIGDYLYPEITFEEDMESTAFVYYGLTTFTITRGETPEVDYAESTLEEETTVEDSSAGGVVDREISGGLPFQASLTKGFYHILNGIDHLLFLAMILIPAPFLITKVENKLKWGGLRTLKDTLIRMVLIVTVFTIGHSITLGLTTVTKFEYPELPVELLVAGSIGLAAVHAWKPLFAKGEMIIAGIFGLFHGVAFAGALQNINMQGWDLARTLIGFNVGVELAHLAVLAVILPLIWFVSKWSKYSTILRPVLAAAGLIVSLMFGVSLVLEELG